MKKPLNPVLKTPIDYRPKAERKAEEPTLAPRTCLVCQKPTQGYGCFAEGYTCSRRCTTNYGEAKTSLIDHVI